MNRLREGQDWLKRRMLERASISSIVYHAGSDSVTLTDAAWEGKTAFRVQDEGNSRLIWNELDLIVPVEKLVINSVAILPKKGHWIEIAYDSPDSTQNFEVSAIEGEQAWRYADPQRTRYRLHLKAKQRS